jgi:hypothetical protein
MVLQEQRMDPKPDYGYDTYKGTGKLKNKVNSKHNQRLFKDCVRLQCMTFCFVNWLQCNLPH